MSVLLGDGVDEADEHDDGNGLELSAGEEVDTIRCLRASHIMLSR